MRFIIRTLLFSYIALLATQYIIGGFSLDLYSFGSVILVVLSLSILNVLVRPILSLISLPTGGIGYLFLSFMLNLVNLYILTLILVGFSIRTAKVASIVFLGVELPSKELTVFWSAVFSALMLSLIFNFLNWLCSKQ